MFAKLDLQLIFWNIVCSFEFSLQKVRISEKQRKQSGKFSFSDQTA